MLWCRFFGNLCGFRVQVVRVALCKCVPVCATFLVGRTGTPQVCGVVCKLGICYMHPNARLPYNRYCCVSRYMSM